MMVVAMCVCRDTIRIKIRVGRLTARFVLIIVWSVHRFRIARLVMRGFILLNLGMVVFVRVASRMGVRLVMPRETVSPVLPIATSILSRNRTEW